MPVPAAGGAVGGSAPGIRGCSLIKRKIPLFLSFLPRNTALPQKERKKKANGMGERDIERKREREGKERNGTSLLLAREEEEVEGSPPGCQAGWHAT